jgi:hypothetical protein
LFLVREQDRAREVEVGTELLQELQQRLVDLLRLLAGNGVRCAIIVLAEPQKRIGR